MNFFKVFVLELSELYKTETLQTMKKELGDYVEWIYDIKQKWR